MWSSGGVLFESGADEVGEGVGGDAAGAAEGDGGELPCAEPVVDGGAAELEAGHDLGDRQQVFARARNREQRAHQQPPSAVNCHSSSLRCQTVAARSFASGL